MDGNQLFSARPHSRSSPTPACQGRPLRAFLRPRLREGSGFVIRPGLNRSASAVVGRSTNAECQRNLWRAHYGAQRMGPHSSGGWIRQWGKNRDGWQARRIASPAPRPCRGFFNKVIPTVAARICQFFSCNVRRGGKAQLVMTAAMEPLCPPHRVVDKRPASKASTYFLKGLPRCNHRRIFLVVVITAMRFGA